MFRFWERPDIIYNLSNAYKEEQIYYENIRSFVKDIIKRKELELEEKLRKGEDLLEIEKQSNSLTFIHKCFLMKRDGIFNDLNLLEQIETILAGGIDTTAIAVTNTIFMLAIHQDVQEKVVEELNDIFGDDDEEDINQTLVSKMKYLTLVIYESLRLFPAGALLARTCLEPLEISECNFFKFCSKSTRIFQIEYLT